MNNIEKTEVVNSVENTENSVQKVKVESNGQLRMLFGDENDDVEDESDQGDTENEEKNNENNTDNGNDEDDPNQDELYHFDPKVEKYWDR